MSLIVGLELFEAASLVLEVFVRSEVTLVPVTSVNLRAALVKRFVLTEALGQLWSWRKLKW